MLKVKRGAVNRYGSLDLATFTNRSAFLDWPSLRPTH